MAFSQFLSGALALRKGDGASAISKLQPPQENIPGAGPVRLGTEKDTSINHDASSDSEHTHDWTALVDPRRDIVQPEFNPYTELSPRHLWLKNQLAKGIKETSSVNDYFAGPNLKLSARDIYEQSMGKALADKVADEANASLSQTSLPARLSTVGVADIARHPVTGTPVFLDAGGAEVPHELVLGGNQPSGVNAHTQESGTNTTVAPAENDVAGAINTVLMQGRQFDDTATQGVLKHIQEYLQRMPEKSEPAKLRDPSLTDALITLAIAGIVPKQMVASVLSMPFQANIMSQQREQSRIDAQDADALQQWKAGLGLLDNELSAAQRRDVTTYQSQMEADRFNAQESNNTIEKQAQLRALQNREEQKAIVSNKRRLQDQAYKIGYGPDSARVDDATRAEAQALWSQLAGISDDMVSSTDAPFFKEKAARLAKMESDARVAVKTEDTRIATATAKLDSILATTKVKGATYEKLKKEIRWYDDKVKSEIARNYQTIAESVDRIRERNFRDSFDMSKEDRVATQSALQRGQIELERLRRENNTDREQIAQFESELNGTANTKGLIAQLEIAKKTNDKSKIKRIEDRINILKGYLNPDNEGSVAHRIRNRSSLYEDVAKDVRELRKSATVKALGNKDDRKVSVNGFTYDMSPAYKFGSNSQNELDCSKFIQRGAKSAGINMPGTCQTQLEWLRSAKGQSSGFTEISSKLTNGQIAFEPGDIVYTKGTPPPKGSGYHVKVFAGLNEAGVPVWMEAKSSKDGVGTFVGKLGGFIGAFRPPKRK